jgi:dethiobiotin synthetase
VSRRVLVTGTDTGVGKTVVCAGLAAGLVRRGRRVLAVKPVETGCGGEPSGAEDGVLLARATGQEDPRHALVRLELPLAPPEAAHPGERDLLDHHAWCEEIRRQEAGHEFVLVEGAGGLLSPLTPVATARELAVDLGAATLVVAADRLGCLNHILLTRDALRAAGLPLLGVVFSAPESTDASTGGNASALRSFDASIRTAQLPRLADPEEASGHLSMVVDWLEEIP